MYCLHTKFIFWVVGIFSQNTSLPVWDKIKLVVDFFSYWFDGSIERANISVEKLLTSTSDSMVTPQSTSSIPPLNSSSTLAPKQLALSTLTKELNWLDAFVDDTDLTQSAKIGQTYLDVHYEMQ